MLTLTSLVQVELHEMASLTIAFCGEFYKLEAGSVFTIGRESDLCVDDNPFLHRRFLRICHQDSLWWIENIGSQLAATIADEAGLLEAWLAPGARIPVVLAHYLVWFTAGPTTYELDVFCEDPPFGLVEPEAPQVGATTYGRVSLTPEQRLLLVALSEPMLKRRVRGAVHAPSSSEAAARLGWTVTKFNRKLDYLCQKLEGVGIRGLHGASDRLAFDRKARLVEHALAVRLVSTADLALLGEVRQNDKPKAESGDYEGDPPKD